MEGLFVDFLDLLNNQKTARDRAARVSTGNAHPTHSLSSYLTTAAPRRTHQANPEASSFHEA